LSLLHSNQVLLLSKISSVNSKKCLNTITPGKTTSFDSKNSSNFLKDFLNFSKQGLLATSLLNLSLKDVPSLNTLKTFD